MLRCAAPPPAGQGELFLLAATLRPETMYGQTNCWALPEGEYGVYRWARYALDFLSYLI